MDLAIFYFYFYFSSARKKRKGGGRKKAFDAGHGFFFFFFNLYDQQKKRENLSLTMHDSRREGGFSPFGKSWSARVFMLLMAFDNDFTA